MSVMSYGANLMITWMMFLEWFKETFNGRGVEFLCPPLEVEYEK